MIHITSSLLKKLGRAFPEAYINMHEEFIVDIDRNIYFILSDCETEDDIRAKVLEWLTSWATTATPYRTEGLNYKLHAELQLRINRYLGTHFTADEFLTIYTALGNRVDHELTMKFIKSNFDMKVLERGKE